MINKGYISTDNLNNELRVGNTEDAEKIEKIFDKAEIQYEKRKVGKDGEAKTTIYEFRKRCYMNVFVYPGSDIQAISVVDYGQGNEDIKYTKITLDREGAYDGI